MRSFIPPLTPSRMRVTILAASNFLPLAVEMALLGQLQDFHIHFEELVSDQILRIYRSPLQYVSESHAAHCIRPQYKSYISEDLYTVSCINCY